MVNKTQKFEKAKSFQRTSENLRKPVLARLKFFYPQTTVTNLIKTNPKIVKSQKTSLLRSLFRIVSTSSSVRSERSESLWRRRSLLWRLSRSRRSSRSRERERWRRSRDLLLLLRGIRKKNPTNTTYTKKKPEII